MTLRRIIAGYRAGFALLVVVTLLARLLVPAGFMPHVDGGRVGLVLCSGMAPAPAVTSHHAMHERSDEHPAPTPEQPCAFAGLGLAAIDAVPPALLLAALSFAFVRALWPTASPPRRQSPRLRPPLRAPPLPA